MTTINRIYNAGEIPALAHGWRSVIALEPGRKWITIIDWTTLETAKLDLASWTRLKPLPHELKPRKVLAAMRKRLEYVQSTAAIKEAMSSLKAA